MIEVALAKRTERKLNTQSCVGKNLRVSQLGSHTVRATSWIVHVTCPSRHISRPDFPPSPGSYFVSRDGELLGAVHHIGGLVFGAAQTLAALIQGLAGLLNRTGHAVSRCVQYAVT